MKNNWIRLSVLLNLGLIAVLFLSFSSTSTNDDDFIPPLEVGKYYEYRVSSGGFGGTEFQVLAEPQGDWVEARVSQGSKGISGWLNLENIVFLSED